MLIGDKTYRNKTTHVFNNYPITNFKNMAAILNKKLIYYIWYVCYICTIFIGCIMMTCV